LLRESPERLFAVLISSHEQYEIHKDIGSFECQRRREARPQKFADRFSGVESSDLYGVLKDEVMIQGGDQA
jgi:hypothetical protein